MVRLKVAAVKFSVFNSFLLTAVPNTIDAKLKITNLEFRDDYNDHESLAFKSLTKSLETEIKKSITSSLEMIDDVNVKIMNLTYGQ